MIQNNSQNVLAAFDVLIEEIEDALRSMNKIGANALDVRDYDMAQVVDVAFHLGLFPSKR